MLRDLVRSVVYSSLWEPIWDRFVDFGAIMMLHAVRPVDPDGILENQSLRVSPERLDRFLATAKKKGFTFVSMDELADLLAAGRSFRKVMAMTFDDGYRDNFETALPVLKAHGVPGLVYLATGLMAGEVIAWWNALEEKVRAQDALALPDGRTFPARTKEEKREAFRQARWWIQKIPLAELDGALAAFFDRSVESLRRASAGEFLALDEVKGYVSEPLLSLGCHTHHHYACENLSQEGFRAEIGEAMAHLASAGVTPRHFAFPYGRGIKGPDHFGAALRDFGFRTVAVTQVNVLRKGVDPYFLPRLALSEFPRETQLPYATLARRTFL